MVEETQTRVKKPVVWTTPAMKQVQHLHNYISPSSFEAADSQVAVLLNAASSLSDFPEKGRVGRRRGTRELVVPGTPYIVAYRITLTAIETLAVIHGARRWPRQLST